MAKLADAQDLGSCSARSGGSSPSSRTTIMVYWIYILRSQKDNKHYTGMTQDIQGRLSDHARGRVASTKSRRPLELVYHEKVHDRLKAREREKYWKSGAGREELKRILGDVMEKDGSSACGGLAHRT